MKKIADLPQPNIKPIAYRKYVLVEDFHFEYETETHIIKFNIPAGFDYDGTSSPRIVWSLLGITQDGVHRAASLIHDWIYAFDGRVPLGSVQFISKENGKQEFVGERLTRKFADDLFFYMLEMYGLPMWKYMIMYVFVTVFGWAKWEK